MKLGDFNTRLGIIRGRERVLPKAQAPYPYEGASAGSTPRRPARRIEGEKAEVRPARFYLRANIGRAGTARSASGTPNSHAIACASSAAEPSTLPPISPVTRSTRACTRFVARYTARRLPVGKDSEAWTGSTCAWHQQHQHSSDHRKHVKPPRNVTYRTPVCCQM